MLEVRTDETIPLSILTVRTDETIPLSILAVRTDETIPLCILTVRTDETIPLSILEVRTNEAIQPVFSFHLVSRPNGMFHQIGNQLPRGFTFSIFNNTKEQC